MISIKSLRFITRKSKVLIAFISLIMLSSFSPNQETKIIAHRGFSGIAPENTLIAFRKAIELGADFIELDVIESKDGELIVMHDDSIDRTSSNQEKGNVAEMTLEELKDVNVGYAEKFQDQYPEAKIPTLAEVLELAKDKIKVCIEIKTDGIESNILETVEKYAMQKSVIIFSFRYHVLVKIRELNPSIDILYLIDETDKNTLDYAKLIQAKAIGIGHYKRLEKDFIDFVHSQNIEIWQWTINDEKEMIRLMDLGLDGLITDFPNKALESKKEQNLSLTN